MFSRPQRKTLIFKDIKCIHTCFVFFPLGVVVLDEQGRVLEKFIINPWRASRVFWRAKYLIETNCLDVLKDIQRGQRLEIVEVSGQ